MMLTAVLKQIELIAVCVFLSSSSLYDQRCLWLGVGVKE